MSTAASTPDESTAYHSSSADRRSADLHGKRSVTVPSSLADSAISLSSGESSTTLSCDDKNRSGDVGSKLHHTLATDVSPGKDKRKRIGLSRLLRGKQKDL